MGTVLLGESTLPDKCIAVDLAVIGIHKSYPYLGLMNLLLR